MLQCVFSEPEFVAGDGGQVDWSHTMPLSKNMGNDKSPMHINMHHNCVNECVEMPCNALQNQQRMAQLSLKLPRMAMHGSRLTNSISDADWDLDLVLFSIFLTLPTFVPQTTRTWFHTFFAARKQGHSQAPKFHRTRTSLSDRSHNAFLTTLNPGNVLGKDENQVGVSTYVWSIRNTDRTGHGEFTGNMDTILLHVFCIFMEYGDLSSQNTLRLWDSAHKSYFLLKLPLFGTYAWECLILGDKFIYMNLPSIWFKFAGFLEFLGQPARYWPGVCHRHIIIYDGAGVLTQA